MPLVTPTFIREYRKSYLSRNGEPLPGQESKAVVLLDLLKLAQEGRVEEVCDIAFTRYGLDLQTMYKDYCRVQTAGGRKYWILQVWKGDRWADVILSREREFRLRVQAKNLEKRGMSTRIVHERRVAA
jgi:hypothetical protein